MAMKHLANANTTNTATYAHFVLAGQKQVRLTMFLIYTCNTPMPEDSYSGQYGGSGLAFKPQLASALLEHSQARPLIVAGGLTSDTVGPIIKQLKPYAVDVSSGVEDKPGHKSASKIRQFISATNNLQRQAG